MVIGDINPNLTLRQLVIVSTRLWSSPEQKHTVMMLRWAEHRTYLKVDMRRGEYCTSDFNPGPPRWI